MLTTTCLTAIIHSQELAKELEIEQIKSLTLEDKLAVKSDSQLEDLEDEYHDEDDAAILQRMRDARLAELKAKAARARFG